MADTIQMTSRDGVTVTVAKPTARTLERMGYVRTDVTAVPAPKPKATRKRASRKTAEPAEGSTPPKGSGPFG